MIKKLFASALMCLTLFTAQADEGMWLPSLIGSRIKDMRSKGFKLSAEDIYSVNKASLKDAVVQFGGGCTGEFLSAEGLLLTNHHCGYGSIQSLSSVEHDYLTYGFWAKSRGEELPVPGLTISLLVKMEDVTDRLAKGEKAEDIIAAARAEGKGYRASIEQMYYGNQQFLFVYQTYRDVRLVGTPPSSIGKFGGDTDNWVWPRHTGDFSIFRVYADADNNPAEYSKDNKPYQPK
ncbi:MAG: S46 family peptidase, partial [Alistipes sp.]|nr:S46 family peptidase [Alistipes sp.]